MDSYIFLKTYCVIMEIPIEDFQAQEYKIEDRFWVKCEQVFTFWNAIMAWIEKPANCTFFSHRSIWNKQSKKTKSSLFSKSRPEFLVGFLWIWLLLDKFLPDFASPNLKLHTHYCRIVAHFSWLYSNLLVSE